MPDVPRRAPHHRNAQVSRSDVTAHPPDVFSISVPLPKGSYPGVNHLGADGFRGGRKTANYHALRKSVMDAAQREMARTGWETATWYCECTWTRYSRTRRLSDPGNGNKVEADALEAAGVVENDTLLRPIHLSCEYDPDGVERIVIVLLRRYPPLLTKGAPLKRGMRPRLLAAAKAKDSKPMPMALLDGKPVPYEHARRMIFKA